MFTLLVLSRFDESGAGPRYRIYQYFDSLKKHGISIVTKPLLNSEYLSKLYFSQKRSAWHLFKKYIERMNFLLFNKSKYDLVLMDGELFPFIPYFVEKLFLPSRYVIDQDDAIFHTYDQSKYLFIRWLLGNKIDKIMKNSAHVIIGNSYVKQRAEKSGAKKVTALPTVLDSNIYKPITTIKQQENQIVIGWVGSPTTAWSLSLIKDALANVAKKSNIVLHVIGADYKIDGLNIICENWPNGWSEEQEIKLINQIDIGIMPLLDAPYQKGKCGFKLIKYMACEKPMIASAVGMNLEIVDHDINGYLASTQAEWEKYLLTLINNPELRDKFGKNGRKKMESEFSLQVTAPVICDIVINTYKNQINV